MQQERLFRLAPEAVTLSAHFVPGQGWSATWSVRRGDEQWSDAYRADYSSLSSAELVDVIEAEASELLRSRIHG